MHDNQDDWLHGWRSHARKWGNLLGNLGKLKRPYQQNWPAQKATDVAIDVGTSDGSWQWPSSV